MKPDSRLLLAGAAIFSVAAVSIAVVLQHYFAMAPCSWCTFQRLIYLSIAIVCALGLLARPLRKPMAALGALLSVAGIAAAAQQHFVAAKTASCDLTFADRVIMALELDMRAPWLFEATANCQDANIPLLGIPFALWSMAGFLLLLALCAGALLRRADSMFGRR